MSIHLPTLMLGAGGRSSRMGQPKHLLAWHGKPWLRHQLGRFLQAGGREAIVVLPGGETPAAEWTEGLDGLELHWASQPDPAAPMSASLRIAARQALENGKGRAWWLPVDVPVPGEELWIDLLDALLDNRALAARPAEGGHPVLLAQEALRMLANAPEPQGMRLDHLLAELERRALVARGRVVDPDCRKNLNTPEAWQAWTDKADGGAR